jgi:hypothetical protein
MRLPYNGNADFAAAGWKLLFVFTRSEGRLYSPSAVRKFVRL